MSDSFSALVLTKLSLMAGLLILLLISMFILFKDLDDFNIEFLLLGILVFLIAFTLLYKKQEF